MEKEPFVRSVKLVQPLWNTRWIFLHKLGTELPYNSAEVCGPEDPERWGSPREGGGRSHCGREGGAERGYKVAAVGAGWGAG